MKRAVTTCLVGASIIVAGAVKTNLRERTQIRSVHAEPGSERPARFTQSRKAQTNEAQNKASRTTVHFALFTQPTL